MLYFSDNRSFFEPDSECLISFVSFRERNPDETGTDPREKKNSAEKKTGIEIKMGRSRSESREGRKLKKEKKSKKDKK